MFDSTSIYMLTWQEFERNTARLLASLTGWTNVQVVGRPGDGGADVLATNPQHLLCLFQCKRTMPTTKAIEEIRKAGRLYKADRLFVVATQKPSEGSGFDLELRRLKNVLMLPIEFIGPDDLIKYSEDLPDYSPNRSPLREYQKEALDALETSLNESGLAHLVMATGLGKTVVASELVSSLIANEQLENNRVLVLAHTNPLVNQLLTEFWRSIPKSIATHRLANGEIPNSFEGITFATRQTMANFVQPIVFDLVIVDEAHHLGSSEYSEILERLKPTRLVGLTATPWRSDNVRIEDWIGRPSYTMGIKEGLANGYLSNVDYKIYIDGINWKYVADVSEHGYTVNELNRHLLIPTRDEEAVRVIRQAFDDNDRSRGIVFSPSQEHARRFASELRRFGFSARALVSDNDTENISHIDRYRTLSEFAAGDIELLCTVDIFNEGIDVPDVDLVVFMRVTHSRRIFVQQLGRGLRPTISKDKLIVLDFAADIRRIHAALDLGSGSDLSNELETLLLGNAVIGFQDKSMGDFFYEWIADLGTYDVDDENSLVKLPPLDPTDPRFNFPDVSN